MITLVISQHMNTLFDIYSTLLIIVYMTCMYLGYNTVQCDEYILDVVYSYIALILVHVIAYNNI